VTTLLTAKSTSWKAANLLSDWDNIRPAWDEFVEGHPKGSVFHTSAMVQVFASAKGHTVMPLAAIADSGEILALLVAVRVQTLPHVLGHLSSRSVWYAEPLCVDSPEGVDSLSDLIALNDRHHHRRTLFAEVRPLQASGAERVSLERHGYQYLDYLNYLIDTTQPIEQIWNSVHHSVNSQVRKCEKRGFEFRHLDGPDCVDILYDFLRLTYGRAGVPLADRSLFEAAYRILKPLGKVDFVAVYDGDKPVAADTLLLFNRRAFAWYGGSLRLSGVSPDTFMQWSEIAWACENGFEWYDFGGAGWPNVPYGVRDFKASFGGELVSHGRYRKVYSRWKLALAERAYEFGRTVISPK
jgi:CelD/BcsL family acetyltransferase involved in cellulose biosynthesis